VEGLLEAGLLEASAILSPLQSLIPSTSVSQKLQTSNGTSLSPILIVCVATYLCTGKVKALAPVYYGGYLKC
jgi:hypothetical protein